MNIFYRCPSGNKISINIPALQDVPDTIEQPSKSLFRECWGCERPFFKPVIGSGKVEWKGYCYLNLEV